MEEEKIQLTLDAAQKPDDASVSSNHLRDH